MKRIQAPVWVALSAALLWGAVSLRAGDLKAKDPRTGKEPLPVKKVVADEEGATCGHFGTSVEFLDNPQAAAKQAAKEEKLVMVLHVSGHFEDPRFT